MVEAAIFIPLMIVAVTQMLKMAFPAISGYGTIIIAFLVGIVVALTDGFLGVTDVNVAQGLVFALEAIGIATIASKAGGGAKGDEHV